MPIILFRYCRRRCLPFSVQQFTNDRWVTTNTLLRYCNAVFSSPVAGNQEMVESTFSNSEDKYAEYRDELDDYVTLTN